MAGKRSVINTLKESISLTASAQQFYGYAEYYNRVFIRGLNVWQGIANPIVERTNWKLAIGGDPKMREIKEKQGIAVPEPKVNVGLVELLRNKPGRPGVTAVLVEGAEKPEDSLVIPVPEEP